MSLTFPEDQSRIPGHASFSVVPAETPDEGGSSETIILPLPEGLSHSDGIEYENTDLGLVRGAIVNASEKDAAKKAGEGGAAGGDEPASDKKGEEKGAFQEMMEGIAMRFGGDTGRLLVGSAPNPNTRAVFKKVGMRQYQFQYKLMPTTTKEAQSIEDIIMKFREVMYPEPEGIVGGNITAFKFPNLFKIEFWIGNGERKKMKPELLPAYLSSMSTSYGGNIMAKNNDNFSYSETTISLTFMEYRALNQADILKGF